MTIRKSYILSLFIFKCLNNEPIKSTVELGYNDIALCDISPIVSGILWYQLTPYCSYNVILFAEKNNRL